MWLPPQWLVEWTQYVAVLAGTIGAVVVLFKGNKALSIQVERLRRKYDAEAEASRQKHPGG